jgi:hypothetical protein
MVLHDAKLRHLYRSLSGFRLLDGKWDCNIKMDLKDIGYEGVDGIYLAKNMNK